MNIKTVLFDKDGTLIDLDIMWFHWATNIYHYLQNNIQSFSLEKITFFKKLGVDQETESIIANSIIAAASEQEMTIAVAYLIHEQGLPWHQACIYAKKAVEYANNVETANHIVKLPNVQELLEYLTKQNIICGILTADTTQRAKHHMEIAELTPYFQFIYGSDCVQNSKPAPDLIYHAIQNHKIDLAKTAYIGDTNADMQMAKSAGCALTIGIGQDLNPNLVDISIKNYSDLLKKFAATSLSL